MTSTFLCSDVTVADDTRLGFTVIDGLEACIDVLSVEMSVLDSGELGGVVRRSSTPAFNEKVLLYLESLPRQSQYQSPTSPVSSESRRMTINDWPTNEHEDPPVSHDQVNGVNGSERTRDWGSNVQERVMSGLPEPGPNDPPGPHYESYGSSFGHMGPLPLHVLNTPPRSSRLTSEDDAATITQEDLAPLPKDRDESLSLRSHLSAIRSQRSRSTVKSLPISPSAQKLKSISSRGDLKWGSPLIKANPQTSIMQNPHYSHFQNGSRRHLTSDGDRTPQQSPQSPLGELDQTEAQIIQDVIASRRSSYALPPSASEQEVVDSHFHDMDLCILLHQLDDRNTHEVVRRALRKAIRQRVKKLGLKHDSASIDKYRNSFHNHDPGTHLQPNYPPQEMPDWAKGLIAGINLAHERFDSLDQKIDRIKLTRGPYEETRYTENDQYFPETPRTQTVNINTAQPTGYTMAESMYPGQEGHYQDDDMYTRGIATTHDGAARTHGLISELGREGDDSPGQQYLEEELYKLRQRPGGSQSATHKTWELGEATRDGHEDEEDEEDQVPGDFTESGLPEIPDIGTERREASLPPIPEDEPEDNEPEGAITSPRSRLWINKHSGKNEEDLIAPWHRIHQRILSWAVIWPLSEIDNALNSTHRGHQVNEIALSIWSTQSYKRYVRSKITDSPGGRPDRLFVPPNLADAISTAVFNGLHGDASGMLKDLWTPFGLEGSPRLIIVLAKHRSDANHWVVHRFSLSDGTLTTYDTYPERTLPDGRPLGWWFSIRAAWPGAVHQNPDRITQKLVRLHRPVQLNIDNSVAAGGIWRNILMGSRAERSLDLERLRDLINTEVKNLRARKIQGKLSLSTPVPPKWEEIG